MANSGRFSAIMAAQKAERWLKENGFTSLPVDPFALAAKLEIVVKAKPDTTPGVSGMLLRRGDNFGILYATHIKSEGFQRFSIAHEIAHYLLEGHPEHLFPDGDGMHASSAGFTSKDPFELEADHFAGGLLMPDPMFRIAVLRAGDGLDAVQSLAEQCRTSLTATAIRYVQKTGVPAAVVMSTGSRIDYCFMSTAMQEFSGLTHPRKGEQLPGGTLTDRFNRDPDNISSARRAAADTDLRTWFGGARPLEATEETIGLGGYGKTLTVITAEMSADEVDKDEDLEERWTARFRR